MLDMFVKEEGEIKYRSLFWTCLFVSAVSKAQELKSGFTCNSDCVGLWGSELLASEASAFCLQPIPNSAEWNQYIPLACFLNIFKYL